VDGDGDGVDSTEDCDDADTEVYPGAMEGCGSGRDEDCDGLVDCEDADCIGATDCTENCANGVDDDSDGLIDCEAKVAREHPFGAGAGRHEHGTRG
jgi:hypothetical protein